MQTQPRGEGREAVGGRVGGECRGIQRGGGGGCCTWTASPARIWSFFSPAQRTAARSAGSAGAEMLHLHLKHFFPHPTPCHCVHARALTYTHTHAHGKRRMSGRKLAALHHRLKQMALHRETLRQQQYVCGSRRCLLRCCCGGWLLVCLAPTHFVYRETDAFLHKVLYNAAPSDPISGLLFHSVSEEVILRVRQPTDHYHILKCVFPELPAEKTDLKTQRQQGRSTSGVCSPARFGYKAGIAITRY